MKSLFRHRRRSMRFGRSRSEYFFQHFDQNAMMINSRGTILHQASTFGPHGRNWRLNSVFLTNHTASSSPSSNYVPFSQNRSSFQNFRSFRIGDHSFSGSLRDE